jgi:hypothetical protein
MCTCEPFWYLLNQSSLFKKEISFLDFEEVEKGSSVLLNVNSESDLRLFLITLLHKLGASAWQPFPK